MGVPEIVGLAVATATIIGTLGAGMRIMFNGLKEDYKRLDRLISNHVMHKLEELQEDVSEQGERIARLEAFVDWFRNGR